MRKGFAQLLLLIPVFVLLIATSIFIYYTQSKSSKTQTSNINLVSPNALTTNNDQSSSIKPSGLPVKANIVLKNISKAKINDGQIVISNLGQLYEFDTNTGSLSLLPITKLIPISKSNRDGRLYPSGLTFSTDGKYLFFNTEEKLFIYAHEAQSTKIVENIGPNAFAGASPDNNYIIVDVGCCPGDRGKSILKIDGTILKSFSGSSTVWSPDSKKIAIEKGDIVFDSIATGPSPTSDSIYIENIVNDKITEQQLFKASNQESYRPIKWVDSNNLIYEKRTYSKAIPSIPKLNSDGGVDLTESDYWITILDNPQFNYFNYNLATNQIEHTDYQPPKISSDSGSYSPDKKWKAFVEGEWPNFVVYISKTDGSSKIKISESDGREVIWKP